MPSFYSGNPANITPRSLLNALEVTAATNASPIVITTSVAHNYNTGDIVAVGLAAGNTAANGTWQINVLTSATFQLLGSYGNGTYTANSAICLDTSLNPPYQIPSAGDPFTVSSINPALEALGDRTQYIQNQLPIGSWTPIAQTFEAVGDDTWTQWSTTNTLGSWGVLTNCLDLFDYALSPMTCNTGDQVVVTINVTGSFSGAAVAIAPGLKIPGSSGNADYTPAIGSAQQYQSGANLGIQLVGTFLVESGASHATMTAFSNPLVTIGGLTGISSSLVGAWISIVGAANAANNGTFYVQGTSGSTIVTIVNPNAVYPDANSGNLIWQFNNMPLVGGLMGYGASGTVALRGHRSFQLTLYREVTTYGTTYPLGPAPIL